MRVVEEDSARSQYLLMGRNLKDRLDAVRLDGSLVAPGSPGASEVEAGEIYLRDDLAERLYELAEFWLVAGADRGDVTYVVGSSRGAFSGERRAGIVELVRQRDHSIGVTAVRIDPFSARRVGEETRGHLSATSNSSIDTVELAWLAKAIDPKSGARRTGAAAFQDAAAGSVLDLLDD